MCKVCFGTRTYCSRLGWSWELLCNVLSEIDSWVVGNGVTEEEAKLGRRSKMAFGLAIIGLGVVILLGNFAILSIRPGELFKKYWPVIPLLWGFVGIVEVLTQRRRGAFIPLVAFLVGGVLLGNKLQWWYISSSRFLNIFFWPMVLILIGLSFFSKGWDED